MEKAQVQTPQDTCKDFLPTKEPMLILVLHTHKHMSFYIVLKIKQASS